MTVIRLGTRGSLLARSQSEIVAEEIRRRFQLQVETIQITTTGDQITDRPLYESGGKGLFIKELEQALLDSKNRLCRPQLQGCSGHDAAGRSIRSDDCGDSPTARSARRADLAAGDLNRRASPRMHHSHRQPAAKMPAPFPPARSDDSPHSRQHRHAHPQNSNRGIWRNPPGAGRAEARRPFRSLDHAPNFRGRIIARARSGGFGHSMPAGRPKHFGNSFAARRPPHPHGRRSRAGRRRGAELRLPLTHRSAGANRKSDAASSRRPRQARRRSARSSREFNCTAYKCRSTPSPM